MIEIILLAVIIILLAYSLFLQIKKNDTNLIERKIESKNKELIDILLQQQNLQSDTNSRLSATIKDSLHNMEIEILKNSSDGQIKTQEILSKALQDIQYANNRKLLEIQSNINEKLDKSLNERLDSSFKQIGEQLSTLYKSLGELQSLSSGVTDLQKTLSNVKTRGIFGEIQLKNILADVFDSSQYDENIPTKPRSSDRVEFALKIPDKEDTGGFIYLPIDSKFPADIYNKIIDCSNNADPDGTKQAVKELEQRIKQEARTIRDKYISPPATTDFAIMFLPTEGLYAEVIRIPGLTEWCQNDSKIVIAGPTTLIALLNSLSIGFRYLTVNKNSRDILKILSAVKTQYDKFGLLIQKTQKKLDEAKSATNDMQERADQIQKRLSKVEIMDESESNKLLEIARFDYPEE